MMTLLTVPNQANNLKNEHDLKNEDNFKNEDDLKDEDKQDTELSFLVSHAYRMKGTHIECWTKTSILCNS